MSSSFSLIVAGLGTVTAAVGSGVLLARCFRGPRPDLIAWSIVLIGLLVSLGAQTLGYLIGFDDKMFRAMELGGQVIAPLALILALSEIAGRSLGARFCARVYIPAVAIITGVVLSLDQLTDVAFTKAWPNPATYYQLPPNYALEFVIGPVTALITAIAVVVVMVRSGKPGWNAILGAQLLAGAAGFLLAYPGLAALVKYLAKTYVPITKEFTVCCAAAAALVLYAGIKAGRLDIKALHSTGAVVRDAGRAGGPERPGDDGRPGGRRRDDRGRRGDADWGEPGPRGDYDRAPAFDQTGDIAPFDAGGQGLYRRGGLYRPEPGDDWRRDGQRADGDFQTGDFQTGDFQAGDFQAEDFQGRDFQAGDLDAAFHTGDIDAAFARTGRQADWDAPQADGGPYGGDLPPGGYAGRRAGGWHDGPDRHDGAGGADAQHSRAELFGQIAIYTLLEDRVDEFDQLTEQVVEEVRRREQDTLVYIVHAVPSAPMQRILYEVYRNRAAYERHRQQPYVQQFEADRRPYVLATNVIELGLQGGKVSPFPSVSELFGEPGYDTSGFERPDYLRDYGRPQASHGEPGGKW
jgi:quinol monooxygenase YgiN